MKKVILLSAISIFCLLALVVPAQYTHVATSVVTINQPHYGELDSSGRLWISEYGNPFGSPVSSSVRCLNGDLSEATFSPIDIVGSFTGSQPSGTTVASDDKVYIGNDGTTDQANNVVIYKSDGTLDGSGYFTAQYPITTSPFYQNIRPGDLDFDNNDNLFLCHKVENAFSVFNRDTGALLSGCPIKGNDWGTGETGTWYINRSIAVNPDGTKVYLADTTGNGMDYFEGSITGGTASYTLTTDGLWTGDIKNSPMVVYIDKAGRLWTPGFTARKIRVYDTYDNSFLAEYEFSEPYSGEDIRLIALSDDSTTLYLGDDMMLGETTVNETAKIFKYTGTPPPAHATPTPPTTPSPTPEDFTAASDWTMYE